MTLRNKTALVTGSTSGIGLAIATKLAESGCNAVFTGIGDVGPTWLLAAELAERHDVRTLCVAADVSRPKEIRDLVAMATRECGTVQILVNNAGIQHVAPLQDFPEDKWDAIIAVNLSAAFHATKAVLPNMQSTGWGRIINIASAHGLVASPGKSAYVAAKHGLVGLTKTTALENAQFGITANAICPGWTRTPLAQKQVDDRAAQSGRSVAQEETLLLGEKQAIAAFTTPEQIADLAQFLCSDSAATITGATLSIDGGWVAM